MTASYIKILGNIFEDDSSILKEYLLRFDFIFIISTGNSKMQYMLGQNNNISKILYNK